MIGRMTRRASSPFFVGRGPELMQLDAAVALARRGQPSLVLIGGEAGVGKTRLATELRKRVEAAGGSAISGGCLDLGEGGLPYGPFVEALRDLVRQLDRPLAEIVLGQSIDTVGILVPELAPPGSLGDGPDQAVDWSGRRARLFDALLAILGRAANARPLVLILEDLHWSDASSRDFLRFLVRNLREERLLVVATYRSDELHRRHPWLPVLSELSRGAFVERIELRRFDRAELAEQLGGILGHRPDADLVDAMLDRSDGLPFYVEELATASDAPGSQLPATLRDVLGQRLAVLSPGALALARAAAVIGTRFSHERLSQVTGIDMEAVSVLVGEAVGAGVFLAAPGGSMDYTFRHALAREAAYDELLPAERVSLHGRLADQLQADIRRAQAPDPQLIADYAFHADRSLDQPRALEASVRAVRSLVDAMAYGEALAHAERALELWPNVADATTVAAIEHADLLSLASRMAGAVNRPERSIALAKASLSELEGPADPAKRLELLAALYLVAWEAEESEQAAAAIEEAGDMVAEAEPSRLKANVLLWTGWHLSNQNRVREALSVFEAAAEMSLALGDRPAWADATACAARALADLGRISVGASRVDASLEFVTDRDGRFDRIVNDLDRSIVMLTAGRFGDSMRIALAGLAQAARYGWEAREGPGLRLCIADSAFELGRLDEVEASLPPIMRGSSIRHHRIWAARNLARVAIVRGRLDAANSLLTDAGPEGTKWASDAWGAVPVVELARAEGRFDALVSSVEGIVNAATAGEAFMPLPLVLGPAIGACADLSVAGRRRRKPRVDLADVSDRANVWLQLLHERVEAVDGGGGAGPFVGALLATAEAEVSRLEGSPHADRWAVVREQWLALHHPYQSAYAALRCAEAHVAGGGDRDAAAEVLRLGHSGAVGLGAIPLQAEIELLARNARIDLQPVSVAPRETADPGRLTSRERGVLQLVAKGHTNREIADQLFISEKTASVHVSNAMGKLGALSRYEAAASAERLGLL